MIPSLNISSGGSKLPHVILPDAHSATPTTKTSTNIAAMTIEPGGGGRMGIADTPALALSGAARAEGTANDFVRSQAANSAFLTDVQKLEYLSSTVFKFETLVLLWMTHTDWVYSSDQYTNSHGLTFARHIRETVQNVDFDLARIRGSLTRNRHVDDEVKASALDLADLIERMLEKAPTTADLSDQGDATAAGKFYYREI